MIRRFLDNITAAACIALLTGLCVLVFAQVFFRYVLSNPLIWSEELARYTFVWLSFIGAAYAAKQKAHVAVELLVIRFPRPLQLVLQIALNVLITGLIVYIWRPGYTFAMFMSRIGSSAMGIPMSWVYLAVPVGLALLALQFVFSSWEALQELRGGQTKPGLQPDRAEAVQGGSS